LWRAVDSLTVVLFAVPSTVLGIGLVILWNRPATSFIYTTPVILLIGFLAQYSVVTSRASVSALSRIPSSMEDAAQICGAGWIRRIATIIVPMARRGLIAGWLIAYIFCVRDLGISMIAYPPGWDSLPVRTFTLMANGAPELIAALCVLMAAVAFAPVGLAALALGGAPRAGSLR
jgi:iron(III) transport system permease protein